MKTQPSFASIASSGWTTFSPSRVMIVRMKGQNMTPKPVAAMTS